jgi:hypothetical protein
VYNNAQQPNKENGKMLLSDFDENDILTSDYDKDSTYQRLLCEVYDEEDEDFEKCLSSFDLYFEVAFVEHGEIQMLKVNASDFLEYLKEMQDGIDATKSIVKFYYEDGSSKGLNNKIELVPVAYVKERNAMYFEEAEEE